MRQRTPLLVDGESRERLFTRVEVHSQWSTAQMRTRQLLAAHRAVPRPVVTSTTAVIGSPTLLVMSKSVTQAPPNGLTPQPSPMHRRVVNSHSEMRLETHSGDRVSRSLTCPSLRMSASENAFAWKFDQTGSTSSIIRASAFRARSLEGVISDR